jgi:hypothetical protein
MRNAESSSKSSAQVNGFVMATVPLNSGNAIIGKPEVAS